MVHYFIGPDLDQVASLELLEGQQLPDFLLTYTEIDKAAYDAEVLAIQQRITVREQSHAALRTSGAAKIVAIAGLNEEESLALFGVA